MRKNSGYHRTMLSRSSLAMAALVILALMAALLTAIPSVSAQTNSPATGQPTIFGTERVTQTLGAYAWWRIEDEDGMENATLSYQWVSNDGSTDTDIPGATGRTYTLQPSDVGKAIKVRVSFTDDAGNPESVTSEATVEVVAEDAGICTRTPVVRDYLVRRSSGVSDCGFVTDEHLAEITFVGLPGSRVGDPRVRSLRPGDFAGLSNVKSLYLDFTDMTELPTGVFSGLSGLWELQISQNPRLATLQKGAFDDLSSLGELRMNANAITELPDGVFEDLSNLTKLEMGNSELTSLPSGALDNQLILEVLTLRGSQLTNLPEGIFDNQTYLEKLDLAFNSLDSIPSDLFSTLHNLEQLDLGSNQLVELPEGVFNGLSALETLVD